MKAPPKPIVLAITAVIGMLLIPCIQAAEEEEFPAMTVEEVQAAIKANSITIIDANGKKVYQNGHVPGAIHWFTVKDEFASALPKEKNALIMAYCGGPG